MTEAFNELITNFATDNNLSFDAAKSYITWLETTGVIDLQEVKNVYNH